MDQDERRGHYRHYISATLAREMPVLRHITFIYPPSGADAGQATTHAVIDAQQPGRLRLVVRSAGVAGKQALLLHEHGFEQTLDPDDPRYAVYAREVENATVDDFVAFVEWVYRRVFDAPDDYMPRIVPIDAGNEGSGSSPCMKSCSRVFAALMLIFVLIFLLMLFLSSR